VLCNFVLSLLVARAPGGDAADPVAPAPDAATPERPA
jgi:hypothetical protein